MTEADSPEPAPAAATPQNPFVPRYREPWVNPAKRVPAMVIGAATAVVLLALGFLLGLGLGGGGHRHGMGYERPGGMYGRGYMGYVPRGPMGPGYGWRHHPHAPGGPYRGPASAVPTPSSSHS